MVGSGGREHALAKTLARDPEVEVVLAAPGNPGIGRIARLHDVRHDEPAGCLDAVECNSRPDLVVIGPEGPLVAGVADAVREAGVACFGPGREAARLEGSKAYAKDVMTAASIPTAAARICETSDAVSMALDEFGPPFVVKDDGLAGGKGVVVTSDRDAALAHAASCERVVIEEYLDGPEVSLFAICDGHKVVPMLPAQDFKRLRDGDEGPNNRRYGGVRAACLGPGRAGRRRLCQGPPACRRRTRAPRGIVRRTALRRPRPHL